MGASLVASRKVSARRIGTSRAIRYKWSVHLAIVNMANTEALYTFLKSNRR
jgi:hypothetical protein